MAGFLETDSSDTPASTAGQHHSLTDAEDLAPSKASVSLCIVPSARQPVGTATAPPTVVSRTSGLVLIRPLGARWPTKKWKRVARHRMIAPEATNPVEAGLCWRGIGYCLRRAKPRPTRPRPSNAGVAGSGTAAGGTSSGASAMCMVTRSGR